MRCGYGFSRADSSGRTRAVTALATQRRRPGGVIGSSPGLLHLRRREVPLLIWATPIADVRQQRLARPSDAEMPMHVVRRGAPGADRTGVDAVEVMRGAYCGAVRGLVSAAARAVQEMMVVEAASGAAPGHGAAPAVARKNRIAVPRLRYPLTAHVIDSAHASTRRGRATERGRPRCDGSGKHDLDRPDRRVGARVHDGAAVGRRRLQERERGQLLQRDVQQVD